jgi:hypothetical protein
VLAVLVRFPFSTRRWALSVLVDLYRAPELNRAEGRPHGTPAQLMCRLLRPLLSRFPGRAFVFVGDSEFGTHEVARFCALPQAKRAGAIDWPSKAGVTFPDALTVAPSDQRGGGPTP